MTAAIILPDNTIVGVIMADPNIDFVPPGYPDGAILVSCPQGVNHNTWTYNPEEGFKDNTPPPIQPNYKVEF